MSMIIRKHYSLTSQSLLHVMKNNTLIYYEEKKLPENDRKYITGKINVTNMYV